MNSFEDILEKQLPFEPSFLAQSDLKCLERPNSFLYKHQLSNHFLRVQRTDCNYYNYSYLLDGIYLKHRMKGPASYCMLKNGNIINLEFSLHGKPCSERSYWNLLSLHYSLVSFDVGTDIEGRVVKEMFWLDGMEIWFYEKGGTVYRINGKKVNRSTFYRVLDKK